VHCFEQPTVTKTLNCPSAKTYGRLLFVDFILSFFLKFFFLCFANTCFYLLWHFLIGVTLMDSVANLLFPLEGSGITSMLASIANIILIVVSTVFFSHFMEFILSRKKRTETEKNDKLNLKFSRRTLILLIVTSASVILLVGLYVYTGQGAYDYAIPEEYTNTSVNWLLQFLDPIVGISGFSSVPFGAFGLNLAVRYSLVLILALTLRVCTIAMLSSRNAFKKFLNSVDKHSEKVMLVDDKAKAAMEKDKTIIDMLITYLKTKMTPFKFFAGGLALLSFGAFVLGSSDPANQILQVIFVVSTVLSHIFPLGMLSPSDGTEISLLLANFATVLLIIFIAFIYIFIIAIFMLFVSKARLYVKGITWDEENKPKLIFNIFITVLVASLCAIGVFFLIIRYDDFIYPFANIINLANSSIFVQLLLITLVLVAIFTVLGLGVIFLAVLVGFIFSVLCFVWHTAKKTLTDIKNTASPVKQGKNGTLTFLGLIIKSLLLFISNTVISVLGIFTKTAPKVRFTMSHTFLGFFAVASFLNTFMGFLYFYVPPQTTSDPPDNPIAMYMLVALTISVALQIAIVVFGLKAGEIYQANKNNRGRRQKNIFWWPYIILVFVSVMFAFVNIFSQLTDRARIENTLFNEIRTQADNLLGVRDTTNNVQQAYETARLDLHVMINDDITEITRRRDIARRHFANLAEAESYRYPVSWHARNDFDNFRVQTQDLDNISEYLIRLLYIDYEAFDRQGITIIEFHHYWQHRHIQTYTSRRIEFSVNGYTWEIGDNFTGIHPLSYGADASTRQAFIADAHWYINPTLPVGRMIGNSSSHSVARGEEITIPYGDKYQVLIEMIIRYVTISNFINNAYLIANNAQRPLFPSLRTSNVHDIRQNATGIGASADFWTAFNKMILTDSIRGSVTTTYRSLPNRTDGMIPMAYLSRIVGDILDNALYSAGNNTAQDDVGGLLERISYSLTQRVMPDNNNTFMTIEALNNYVETSISLYHILAILEREKVEYALPSAYETSETPEYVVPILEGLFLVRQNILWAQENLFPTTEYYHGNVHTVRMYRDYANSISRSNFLLSFDILFRGISLNPHRNVLNSIYSAWILALSFLIICIAKDYFAFYVGRSNFYNRPIYKFEMKKDSLLDRIGYLKYDEQLSAFFDMPTCNLGKYDVEELYLHRMFVHDILTDKASTLCDKRHHAHQLHDKHTPTEALFYDLKLMKSYLRYKKIRYNQLYHVFGINMIDAKEKADLQSWLSDYTKGL